MLELSTDASVYARGEDGTVHARSLAPDEIHFDLCPWELDRWAGDRWELQRTRPDVEVRLPLLTVLRPGQTAIASFTLPDDLAPGRYRLRYERVFDASSAQLPLRERVSRLFQVD